MSSPQINATANQTADLALAGARGNARGAAGQTPTQMVDAGDALDAQRRQLENRLDGTKTVPQETDPTVRADLRQQSAALKAQSAELHGPGYTGMQQKSADALRKRHKIPKPSAPELAKDVKIAKECLEKFRKSAMDQMRAENIQKYATKNSKGNLAEATAKNEEAKAALKKAEQAAEASGSQKNQDALMAASERAKKSKRDLAEAQVLQNGPLSPEQKCNRAQADLCLNHAAPNSNGTLSLPPFEGQVPGARVSK